MLFCESKVLLFFSCPFTSLRKKNTARANANHHADTEPHSQQRITFLFLWHSRSNTASRNSSVLPTSRPFFLTFFLPRLSVFSVRIIHLDLNCTSKDRPQTITLLIKGAGPSRSSEAELRTPPRQLPIRHLKQHSFGLVDPFAATRHIHHGVSRANSW